MPTKCRNLYWLWPWHVYCIIRRNDVTGADFENSLYTLGQSEEIMSSMHNIYYLTHHSMAQNSIPHSLLSSSTLWKSGLSKRAVTHNTCCVWVYLLSPWCYRWHCPLLIQFCPQSNKFVTGAKIKAMGNSKLGDSPQNMWLIRINKRNYLSICTLCLNCIWTVFNNTGVRSRLHDLIISST